VGGDSAWGSVGCWRSCAAQAPPGAVCPVRSGLVRDGLGQVVCPGKGRAYTFAGFPERETSGNLAARGASARGLGVPPGEACQVEQSATCKGVCPPTAFEHDRPRPTCDETRSGRADLPHNAWTSAACVIETAAILPAIQAGHREMSATGAPNAATTSKTRFRVRSKGLGRGDRAAAQARSGAVRLIGLGVVRVRNSDRAPVRPGLPRAKSPVDPRSTPLGVSAARGHYEADRMTRRSDARGCGIQQATFWRHDSGAEQGRSGAVWVIE